MRISVVGTGYVGLVTGTCFSEVGNRVICVDVDEEKIKHLQNGNIPFYEPGLSELVLQNQENERLSFTTNIEDALKETDICFIAVGTPMGGDGQADLRFVSQVAQSIGQYMTHEMIIVDKSTVPVGTGEIVRKIIQDALLARGKDIPFAVVSNPEFLKEGNAIKDSMSPDRVVIGSDNQKALETMKSLYKPFVRSSDRFITMDLPSAEMTKYASNAMLATRISFMNEIAAICEQVGADVGAVRLGMGSDSRIGYPFLYAGAGYGGSCFPKDVQALVETAKQCGVKPRILESVQEVNFHQKRLIAKKIRKRFGEDLSRMTFGMWGISFKPETDDIRDATSMVLIEELSKLGAQIKAYDPKAMEEAEKHYLKPHHNVTLMKNRKGAYEDVDALILVTEWKEFRTLDFEDMKAKMKQKIIFDGRNIYSPQKMTEEGFELYQIGVSNGK